jgi:PAS domain S-box-containing protein
LKKMKRRSEIEQRAPPRLRFEQLAPAPADLVAGAVIVAAYFGAAKLGLTLAYENSSITAIWPPTGIALAALVLWGFRFWPAVALGALLANSWTGLPLVSTLGITVGNTLEALAGAFLLVSVARFRPSLERVRDVFALVAFAAAISTMVSATFGVTSLWIGDEIASGDLPSAWRLWWLGDMGGDLIVAPFLFALATIRPFKSPPRRQLLEGLGLVVLVVASASLTFSRETQLEYLVFPLLAWAALRFGLLGATTATLIVAAVSVWFTARGTGPFAQASRDDSLLLSLTFVGVASAMSLLIAAFVAERNRARAALKQARDELEQRVQERTARLKRSQASLAEAQQLAHLGSWEWDVVADELTWSDELYRIYGQDRDSFDATYEGFLQCIHPSDRDRLHGVVSRALKDGAAFEFEHRIVRPDGEVRFAYGRGEVVTDRSGQPIRVFGTGLDITQQKRLEQESNRFWNLSLDLLAISDFEFNLQHANPAHQRILGYSEDELKAEPWLNLVHPDDRERVLAEATKLATASMEIGDIETRMRRKDGSYCTLLCSAKSDRDERQIYTVAKDITEWKRAEEAERLAAIVESSDDAIISSALDGTIRSWNPGAERLYGYSAGEMEGQSISRIVPLESSHELARSLAQVRLGRSISEYDTVREGKDGCHINVSLSLSPIRDEDGRITGVSAIHRDIADRLRAEREKDKLEAELNAAHRLESLGQLAGGVAHDFNNILAVIINYARFVADEVPDDSRAFQDVDEIRRAANRGATLTRQLLILGRRDVAVPEVLSVDAVVRELGTLLRSAVGERVNLETRLDGDLWPVEADSGQIEQVLVNLAVNARDAMPDGGTVTIETANVELGEQFVRFHPDAAAGRYVRLRVSDTGMGMEEEVATRVFEPFFTTKPEGEGTGLGLATVYGIVKSAGGTIDLDSKAGRGTTFAIHLPAALARGPTVKRDAPAPPPRGDAETVLLVEDEDPVRELAQRILSSQGYTVLDARNGREAIDICAREEQRIDLLLTDVIMPRMNGTDLAKRITGERPGMPVLFMSGYGHEAVLQEKLADGTQFIEKPFGAEELLRRVRSVLDSSIAAEA